MMDTIIDLFGVRLTPALPALTLLVGTICWLVWFTVTEDYALRDDDDEEEN